MQAWARRTSIPALPIHSTKDFVSRSVRAHPKHRHNTGHQHNSTGTCPPGGEDACLEGRQQNLFAAMCVHLLVGAPQKPTIAERLSPPMCVRMHVVPPTARQTHCRRHPSLRLCLQNRVVSICHPMMLATRYLTPFRVLIEIMLLRKIARRLLVGVFQRTPSSFCSAVC